ncbi:MAG: ribose 5-phosphate isomerase B [Bacteroidales bacterium]|nr:ribose 5-phosphate isomerase B [Bacteroidales bacterium]
MYIGIASDHAGFEMKQQVLALLKELGYDFKDFGTYSADSCDYPDFAHPLAYAVEEGSVDCGIALCGSGNGISITLNKHQGVRSAICWNKELAALARQHNNANILTLPARFITFENAVEIINTYLTTPFEGGRHQRRVEKIPCK